MRFDLSGRIDVSCFGDDASASYVRRQMLPFLPVVDPSDEIAAAGVILEAADQASTDLVEIQGPANDGLRTATDGERFLVIHDGRRCVIPNALAEEPVRFVHTPGFPIWRIYRSAVRPSIHVALARSGRGVAAHAAAVTVDEGAIVVAGWSESGKTETALGLLETGASFLSDKWTVLGPDGDASAFPITVGIRRWALEYLPTLSAASTTRARVQFAGARVASALLDPLARRPARSRLAGTVTDGVRGVMALGDRVAFEVDELRTIYGTNDDPARVVPIRAVVTLTTIPAGPIEVRPGDARVSAARLARSAAYERRRYFELLERAAYLQVTRPTSIRDEAAIVDEGLLWRVLSHVPLIEVRAPFPADPRPVAEAILRAI
jgi:hypothetical protein